MIYIVLGMHKSGTTLISSVLHRSGINMGVGFDSGNYDSGNQFERKELRDFNKSVLGTKDDRTLKLTPPSQKSLSQEQIAEIRTIIKTCEIENAGDDWGMKDPRTALTYPLWKNQVPAHKLIAIFRYPEQIWPRYRWKGLRKKYVNVYWAWHFLNRWIEHNETIIEFSENKPKHSIVIDYISLMNGQSDINSLMIFVERPLVDIRKNSLYRNKKGYDISLLLAKWAIRLIKKKSVDEILEKLQSIAKVHRGYFNDT